MVRSGLFRAFNPQVCAVGALQVNSKWTFRWALIPATLLQLPKLYGMSDKNVRRKGGITFAGSVEVLVLL